MTRPEAEAESLARAYARSFSGPEGARVLAHLSAITAGRVLGPEASCAQLRHLEGQRQLVRLIHRLVEQGRGAPLSPSNEGKESNA